LALPENSEAVSDSKANATKKSNAKISREKKRELSSDHAVKKCEITVVKDDGSKETSTQELNLQLKFAIAKLHEEFG